MSVLKKIGSALLKVGAVAAEVLQFPFLANLLGAKAFGVATTVLGDFGSMAQILSLMEVAYPTTGSGSQRLAGASPAIQQIILTWAQSNLPGHSKIKTSPELFAQHVTAFTSSFADILNDFGD